jgi:hypothetical protein
VSSPRARRRSTSSPSRNMALRRFVCAVLMAVNSWRAHSRIRKASRSPSARGVGSFTASSRNAYSTARCASIGSDLPLPRRVLRVGCSASITGIPAAITARASPAPLGTPLGSSHVRREFRRVIRGAARINPDEWTPREPRHSFVSLLRTALSLYRSRTSQVPLTGSLEEDDDQARSSIVCLRLLYLIPALIAWIERTVPGYRGVHSGGGRRTGYMRDAGVPVRWYPRTLEGTNPWDQYFRPASTDRADYSNRLGGSKLR